MQFQQSSVAITDITVSNPIEGGVVSENSESCVDKQQQQPNEFTLCVGKYAKVIDKIGVCENILKEIKNKQLWINIYLFWKL